MTKKIRLYVLLGFAVGLLTTVALVAYVVYTNDVPITKGDIEYNIPYKKDLTLDIYQPTRQIYPKIPVVIFFHGGGWITGRKETININRFSGAINELREKGYAIVTPNYTLATRKKSPFPDCIIDAFEAVDWVEMNGHSYQFDLNNVGLMGESAGAHIAMMVAYSKPEKFLVDQVPPATKFNYLVDIYGPNDLDQLYHMKTMDTLNAILEKLPDPIHKHLDISRYLFGFDPNHDTTRVRSFIDRYSPVNYIDSASLSTLLIHGNKDQIVPVDQSIALSKKLDALQVNNELHLLDNVNHAFIGASDGQKDSIQQWIVAFIEKHYNE